MPDQNMSIKWFEWFEYSTILFAIIVFIILILLIFYKLTNLIWNIKPKEEEKTKISIN